MVLDHRHAPYRPFRRLDRGLLIDDHRRRAGPILPLYLGLDNPAIWIIAVIVALAIGAAIGAFQGSLVAYLGIPSFIVTLGGQLFWRGAAWWVTTGQTIAPLDDRFALMGGGPHGSIGATASWALAAICCAGIVFGIYAGRQRRARFRFPQRPMWAEYVIAVVGCFVVIGATAIVNAYPWPERVAAAYAEGATTFPCPKADCSFRPDTRFPC